MARSLRLVVLRTSGKGGRGPENFARARFVRSTTSRRLLATSFRACFERHEKPPIETNTFPLNGSLPPSNLTPRNGREKDFLGKADEKLGKADERISRAEEYLGKAEEKISRAKEKIG